MIQFEDSYDPRNFDILLTDIDSKDLHENISKQLNVKYLSDAPNELNGDIVGIVYGFNLRLFCATTVKIKNKVKMVIFLVDTGSPTTFISENVLRSFGVEMADPVNGYMNVGVNGRTARIMMSHSHFTEINVMGMMFLNANDVGIHVYCSSEIFYLNFNQGWDGMDLRREKERGGSQSYNYKRIGNAKEDKSAFFGSYLLALLEELILG